jgi:S-methylmethionine-dependent homocysteine/selenocysteine methylase
MRSIAKQDAIRRARLKLIKIATFQNKAFAFKRSEMRDRRLATKAKLKGGQMQNRAREDSIRNITCIVDSIGSKAPRSPMLVEHHPSHLNKSAVLSFNDFILLRNMQVENY